MSTWPVVVVTGANAGVGFGICRRLIFQLCLSNPPDSWPQSWANSDKTSADSAPVDGLTLIMACRSTQRADAARKDLYKELDVYMARLRARPGYDGHADVFRRNLKIEIEYLDLAALSSVFNFGEQMSKKHSYISHLVLNAGIANFTHIDWLLCFKQLSSGFLSAITAPQFYVQSAGEVSVDGLGWIWQSNLFGHYVLFRALEPLLKNSAYPIDSRIIWSSSVEASPKFYDHADWQLTKTEHSYESVKYQIDLIATILDRQALQDSSASKRIRHFISHPGVCSTKISNNLVVHGGVLDNVKVFVFYLGRILFGSRHHPITPANSAVAAVHLILVSISFIALSRIPLSKTDAEPDPVRFGSETDRWGHAEVGLTPVRSWKENEAHGEFLVGKCDELYWDFSEKRVTSISKS
ncbi:hypothetical protein DFH07DRAFT_813350 [Mycena maculata]|uniref:3-keto sterol reductase n=1 Tax=Mycena maculata TaxID=230809 RepID=A0AAD7JHN1_9AGAR|nr:hypothetical protein DFH07DRAFT_813350 [Mycena maculata]